MKVESRRCSIPTAPLIPSSFSRYQSRRFSSGHVRCALITQIFTPNCKSIFDRIQSNILLSQQIGIDIAQSYRRATVANVMATAGETVASLIAKMTVRQLLRLRDNPEIRLRRVPALRITFLCFLVRDRAGNDHILARLPVHWSCYLMFRRQL